MQHTFTNEANIHRYNILSQVKHTPTEHIFIVAALFQRYGILSQIQDTLTDTLHSLK
jgi:hypothetical protein